MKLEDGSMAWVRANKREKWWPAMVFKTWSTAQDAGLVPDGIGFLIPARRQVHVFDKEAEPQDDELVVLFMGDEKEWDIISESDETTRPYLENLEKMKQQRLGAQLKHQFKKAMSIAKEAIAQGSGWDGGVGRGGAAVAAALSSPAPPNPKVGLDFGMGTSFQHFSDLWRYLLTNRWTSTPGRGLADWHYWPPGVENKKFGKEGRDYFTSEDAVIDYVRRNGLALPSPVEKVFSPSPLPPLR
ncbi:unnamed protein product [Choristocarpus tenellus]